VGGFWIWALGEFVWLVIGVTDGVNGTVLWGLGRLSIVGSLHLIEWE